MKPMLERLEELQRRQREIFGDGFPYLMDAADVTDAETYAKEQCPLEEWE